MLPIKKIYGLSSAKQMKETSTPPMSYPKFLLNSVYNLYCYDCEHLNNITENPD
jgi:hypothetical protein